MGQEGPPLCQGLWAQKSSVQFQEVWLSSDEAPASCGSEGVRGVRGSIWGAGWRAWASCLAHGGGGGGRSLRRLPRGCISVGGNGSIVHTRFCSQTLFLGCKGAGSLGSQFSTGPGIKRVEKGGNQERWNQGRQASGFQLIRGEGPGAAPCPSHPLTSSVPLRQSHWPQMFQVPFYPRV